MSKGKKSGRRNLKDLDSRAGLEMNDTPQTGPESDEETRCEVCGRTPVLLFTGLCSDCTLGEVDTPETAPGVRNQ